MKAGEEQIAAAVDLLRRRVRERGGPAEERARELCDGELRGFLPVSELMAAYCPEVTPRKWVADDDHDRDLDYYAPDDLTDVADAGAGVVPEGFGGELEREAIARILRRLEAGGGLLRRKVRWVYRYHTLQPGQRVETRKGPGQVRCGERLEEWLERAVLIVAEEGRVVKVFSEHRRECLRAPGWNGSRKPVLEMMAPEIDAPELALRRIAMSVAVLLRVMRKIDRDLNSAAAIARAAGVTRANVSARQLKMEAEEAAEGAAQFKTRRRRKAS